MIFYSGFFYLKFGVKYRILLQCLTLSSGIRRIEEAIVCYCEIEILILGLGFNYK